MTHQYNLYKLLVYLAVLVFATVELRAQSHALSLDDVCQLARQGAKPGGAYQLKYEDVITSTNKSSSFLTGNSTISFLHSGDSYVLIGDYHHGTNRVVDTKVASNSVFYTLTQGAFGEKPTTPELYIEKPHARFFGNFDFIDKQLFCNLLGELRNSAVLQPDAESITVSGETTEFTFTNLLTIKVSTQPNFHITSVNMQFPNDTVVDAQFTGAEDGGSFWKYRQIAVSVQDKARPYSMQAGPIVEQPTNTFPKVSILEGLKKGSVIHDERKGAQNIYRYNGQILTEEKAKVEHERVAGLATYVPPQRNAVRWIVILALALLPLIFASIWRLQRVAKPRGDEDDEQSG